MKLQEDLDRLYEWAKENNMMFNGTKFQVVKYGRNSDLKYESDYLLKIQDILRKGLKT